MAIDTLHVCDQGVTSHVVGSVFIIICKNLRRGGKLSERVEQLGVECDQWYARRGQAKHLRGKLTLPRLRNTKSGYAKLKAKGASARALIHFALHIAQQEIGDLKVVALCQLLCELYGICSSNGMYLEQAALDRFKFIGKHVARIYCELSRAAFGKEKTWKMQAKLHLFIHLLEWQTQETNTYPKTC